MRDMEFSDDEEDPVGQRGRDRRAQVLCEEDSTLGRTPHPDKPPEAGTCGLQRSMKRPPRVGDHPGNFPTYSQRLLMIFNIKRGFNVLLTSVYIDYIVVIVSGEFGGIASVSIRSSDVLDLTEFLSESPDEGLAMCCS